MRIECVYDKLVATNSLKPNPANPNVHPPEQVEKLAELDRLKGKESQMRTQHKNVSGWWTVAGKAYYFKSMFEMRWACVLELCRRYPTLAQQVLGHDIVGWEYEPRRFYFYPPHIPKGMTGKQSGVRIYTPDFKVMCGATDLVGENNIIWHECKGYMDGSSRTKLRCFHTYYAAEQLWVIINRLPGRRSKSLARRAGFDFLKQCDYKLLEVQGLMNSLKQMINNIAVEGVHYGTESAL